MPARESGNTRNIDYYRQPTDDVYQAGSRDESLLAAAGYKPIYNSKGVPVYWKKSTTSSSKPQEQPQQSSGTGVISGDVSSRLSEFDAYTAALDRSTADIAAISKASSDSAAEIERQRQEFETATINAQAQAEAARSAKEYQDKLGLFEGVRGTASGYGLAEDNDNYAGESSAYLDYASRLNTLLGGVGKSFDQTQYDIYGDVANARSSANDFYGYRSGIEGSDATSLMGRYGTSSTLQQDLSQRRDNAQSKYSVYNQSVQQKLAGLQGIYQAYAALGDPNQFAGSDSEQIGQLTLGDPRGLLSTGAQAKQAYTQDAESQLGTLDTIARAFGGDTNTLAALRQSLSSTNAMYDQQANDISNFYGNASNQLLNLYGDAGAVGTGLFSNTANQYKGDLSSKVNTLSSTLGNLGNTSSDLAQRVISTRAAKNQEAIATKSDMLQQQAQQAELKKRADLLTRIGGTGSPLDYAGLISQSPSIQFNR